MEQSVERPAPFPTTRLIIGIFLAALGVLMALDNLNVIDADSILRFWPLLLIAIGIAKINDETSRGLGGAAIVAGVILLVWTTHFIRFSIFDLWPLLIVAAGVVIVAQAIGYRPSMPEGGWYALLTHRKLIVDSRDFRGGRILALLGGVDLDLSGADIATSPAVIELLVFMGGIEMLVPDGWEIVGDAIPFMGGMDIKVRSIRSGKQLILRGLVMMGGVEVKGTAVRTA